MILITGGFEGPGLIKKINNKKIVLINRGWVHNNSRQFFNSAKSE